LTPVETTFSDTLLSSNGLPQTPQSVLSFVEDNNDLFELAAADLAKQPVIQDLAKEATLAEQTPLNFFLAEGAAIIGPAINTEASAIETAFTIDTATAQLIGSAILLGGVASAYDSLNGTDRLASIENHLTPQSLQDICALARA
jgi:hypothetical protein